MVLRLLTKKRKIILAGAVGLAMSVFLVLFMESIRNARGRWNEGKEI